jgi:hypothetical protein
MAAREVMRERGHCKGELTDDGGRVCLRGALVGELDWTPSTLDADELIWRVLPEAFQSNLQFNDAEATTQADVESLFDAAASAALDGLSIDEVP